MSAPGPELRAARSRIARLAPLLAALMAAGPEPAAAAAFPLRASADGRYLVDQAGTPFFMVGDSPQALAHLPAPDRQAYLSTRQAQGFNSIQVYLFPFNFPGAAPYTGGNGTWPFTGKIGGGAYAGEVGTADFTTPNESFFSFIDGLLDDAAARGFLVHLYALDWGYGGDGKQGWWLDIKANPSSALQSLGTYVGNRYRSRTNVIWVDGSDYGQSSSPTKPDAANEDKVVAMIQAMQTAGAVQLRTGDWNAPSSSTDEPKFTSYMQVNGIYSYGGSYPGSNPFDGKTYLQSRLCWSYAPVAASQGNPGATSVPPALPCYEKETGYEGENLGGEAGDAASVRKYQWWSVLSGGTAGLFFAYRDTVAFTAGWQSNLSTPGALDMQRLAAFVQGLPWWKLVPSELSGMRRLVTSGNGTQSGSPANYVAAAQASDGTLLLAYVPPVGSGAQGLTVDLRSMAAAVRARWWDPTNGAFRSIGDYDNAGAQAFTTPGNNSAGANDWLLVIEPASGPGLSVSPASASAPPRGQVAFGASGGSGTGYAWSLASNASGGAIDPTTGAYRAGAKGSVTDVVRVTDSASSAATASVSVTAGVSISPSTSRVAPGGQISFTATGGSGTGFTWSIPTNASGGSVTAGGLYTAGAADGVTDVVQVADSLQNVATRDVLVSSAPPPPGGAVTGSCASGCSSASAALLTLALLAISMTPRGPRRGP